MLVQPSEHFLLVSLQAGYVPGTVGAKISQSPHHFGSACYRATIPWLGLQLGCRRSNALRITMMGPSRAVRHRVSLIL
eukprot:scaffold17884_cov37-Attheya_sp.AAC.2